MKLIWVEIWNYRNLDGIEVALHPDMNFIVGENNLGKSNFLAMLNTISASRYFRERDFKNPDNSIEINLQLQLDDEEIGLFDDYFSPHDEQINIINITLKQDSPEEIFKFLHKETEEEISHKTLRKLNFINYSSFRNPQNELNFDRGTGGGKFLKYLVERYLKENSTDGKNQFIDENDFTDLLKYLNKSIGKIETINNFSIAAHLDNEVEKVLSKLIVLKGNGDHYINDMGYGVQFLNIIPLVIIDNIYNIIEKSRRSGENVLEQDRNEHYLPVIIGIDEPEIHLHPFMQRSLIKYLSEITKGEDQNFNSILKDLFDVDRVKGQLIFVTHSPFSIQNNYKHIVRFFQDESGELSVKSGSQITFKPDIEKHLNKNMEIIKEAFYAKSVLVVEGETEEGAFPIFAQKLGYDFDKLGVSIVRAGSVNSVPPLMNLFNKFGVNAVGIIDKDDGNMERKAFQNVENLFETNFVDFEEELSHSFQPEDYASFLVENIPEKKGFLIGTAKKLNIQFNPANPNLHEEFKAIKEQDKIRLKSELQSGIHSQLSNIKSIIVGKELGKHTTVIPQIYIETIRCLVGGSDD
ncbi:hypothetical protein N780_15295 [Pontibacillus chungwhensis BH030062]|uniref:Uncharacterized protein n=1 Tax=Pontibacillus chungwhensis BH030062 TaxID=1385513 RepID=A0A0A2UZJ9_9BACI|nr:AAA family ATPase [Pontibacillus chungwhensis]KGP91976.1 hypothetical protein N780_15295 [Pontibacillus chungwhensis BH030062]